MQTLTLLPQPRSIRYREGTCTLTGGKLIVVQSRAHASAARRLKAALARLGLHFDIAVTSGELPAHDVAINLRLSAAVSHHPDRYYIDIDSNWITIGGGKDASTYWHGVCTLVQIIEQCGATLPCMYIEDWPDIARRGVMLDISRDKVPTMDTLYGLIDLLAGWKINEVQLYTEHTFAYRQHKKVWEHASPITAEQIQDLDAFCRERFIDLVPNQNSFGHMHRWLYHPEYRHMAEVPEGLDWPLFLSPRPFTISPVVPESIKFIEGLYNELLPNFSSSYFNVGCDETFDLGKGRSAKLVDEKGKVRVYLDFLKQISALVEKHGRTMMFWGDIIKQDPALVPELGSRFIALEWGYEAYHPFDSDSAIFANAGVPFYVCPGTSSWLSLIGRTENAIGNLQNAAENGIRHGAGGYLITDWGDWGHWQPLPVSYLGFAYGAAVSWAYEANKDLDIPAALDRFAFHDPTGTMGKLAHDLGNAYRLSSDALHINSATMVRSLFTPVRKLREHRGFNTSDNKDLPDADKLREAIAEVDKLAARLDGARPADPLVIDEYRTAIALWKHGCKRLIWASDPNAYVSTLMGDEIRALMAQHAATWLLRNRPGGLGDSLTRMARLVTEYETW